MEKKKKYIDQLIEKWDRVLTQDGTSDIGRVKTKKATAIMLENQYNYMVEQGMIKKLDESTTWSGDSMNSTSGYEGDGEFHKIALPMVRRTFPELIAHEVVGVQPMTTPVGLAFALRFQADQSYAGSTGTEVGYNTIDQRYSGTTASAGMTTSAGEALGSNAATDQGHSAGLGLGIGDGTAINELSMTVEKAQVTAKTRKLRSRWSLEVAQDLKAMHGLDLEEEMMDVLAYEITQEIDRELIEKMRTLAGTNVNSDLNVNYGTELDGRWEAEKYRNMYNLLIRKANTIAVTTRRGSGNFTVCAPSIAAAFEATSAFTVAPVNNDINTAQTGIARIGSLDGRITVYRDTFATTDDFIIGYKGPSEYDTGIIYLPYIQLMASKATFEDSFQPTVGLMSRYAIHDHIFGSQLYYVRVVMTNLYAKG